MECKDKNRICNGVWPEDRAGDCTSAGKARMQCDRQWIKKTGRPARWSRLSRKNLGVKALVAMGNVGDPKAVADMAALAA